MVVLVLALQIQRAFLLSEEPSRARDAIGERSWHGWATRSELAPVLDGLLEGRPGATSEEGSVLSGPVPVLAVDRGLDPDDRLWVVTMVRYACPGSGVEWLQPSVPSEGTATEGGPTVLRVTPACRPRVPEVVTGAVDRWTGISWLVALGLAVCVGVALLRGLPTSPAGWAVAATVGWAGLAVSGLVAWHLLGELRWGLAACSLAALAVVSRDLVRGSPERSPPQASRSTDPDGLRLLAGATLTAAAAVSAWKLLVTPLWSWDHHAIWGLKARKIAVGATEFLREESYLGSAPDYPLGLPVAWLAGTLGSLPDAAFFRWSAVLMALAVVALLLEATRGRAPSLRLLAGACVASSPLLWDSEGFGLAEVPLALWSLAALGIARSRYPGRGVGVVVLIAMLASTKQEGTVLAVALLPVLLLLLRRRAGSVRGALGIGASALLALVAVRVLTAGQSGLSSSFLRGAAVDRLAERAQRLPTVLADLAAVLVDPSWLGLWIAAPAWILGVALACRRFRTPGQTMEALALFSAAAVVMAVYGGVYLASYVEPDLHIATSWHRIVAPILAWMLVAAVWIVPGSSDPV